MMVMNMKCPKCNRTDVEILEVYDRLNDCDIIVVSCFCGYSVEFFPVIERYKNKVKIRNKVTTLVPENSKIEGVDRNEYRRIARKNKHSHK